MGTAKYVGRVGALAVALGIGTAVNAMPWVAVADPTAGSSSSSESSSTPSGTESASADVSKPAASVDSSASARPDAESPDVSPTTDDESDLGQETSETSEAEPADEEATDEEPVTDSDSSRPQQSPDSVGSDTESVASFEDSDNDRLLHAMTDPSTKVVNTDVADNERVDADTRPGSMDRSVGDADPPLTPVSPSEMRTNIVAAEMIPAVSVRSANPVGGLVSIVSSWLGLRPQLTGGPSAPVESPLQWGLLEWARRQIRHTLFNQSPTVAYNPAENRQSAAGVITGDLNAVDPDGDPLTFNVTEEPQHGSLQVNRDGTFTYTPDAEFARTAISDTFTIVVDDGAAYRLSGVPGLLQTVLHRFAQVIGLSDADVVDSHPNLEVNPVIATIELSGGLSDVAISPDSDRAYVVGAGDNEVSVIDTATNTVVATIPVGEDPYAVAVRPDGARAYVTNRTDDTVSVINTVTNTVVATIAIGNHPLGLAFTPDGARAYVAVPGDNVVRVINTATHTVATTIPVGNQPVGVAVSPDGTRVYVSNTNGDTVTVIDTATNAVITAIPVGNDPGELAVSPDGTRIYVVNNDLSVSIIDTASGAVTDKIIVGDHITDVAVNPDGSRVYVTNYDAGTVLVINTATNTVAATVSVDGLPSAVAVSPDGNRAYVAHVGDTTVVVIAV